MGCKISLFFTVLVFLFFLASGFIYAQPLGDDDLLRVVFLGGQQGELQPCG